MLSHLFLGYRDSSSVTCYEAVRSVFAALVAACQTIISGDILVYFGRDDQILQQREEINRNTIVLRCLPDRAGEVLADSAYHSTHFSEAVRAKGGTPV